MKLNQKLLIVFFLAIILRIGMLIISIQANGFDNFINNIVLAPGNDPYTYHRLATNIIQYNSFTYQPGLPPVSLRTPGYPLFIAINYSLFGENPLIVLLTQIVLDSLIVIIIYKTANLFLNQSISIIAALLYSLEPHAAIFSLSMYSDTIFVFTMTLFSYFFIKFSISRKISYLILSGFTLGVANLIKPSGMFIPLIVIIIIFLIYKKNFKSFIAKSFTFIIVFSLTITPWILRNYIHFNKIFLSTAGEYNLLVLNIAPIKINELKIQQDNAIFQLLAEADSLMITDGKKPMLEIQPSNYWEELSLQYDFNKAYYWKKLAIYYISNYTIDFIKFYFLGVFHSFANLGTGTYSVYFNLEKKENHINIKEEENILKLLNKFIENKSTSEIIIALIIGIYLVIVYLCLAVGLFNLKMINAYYLRFFIVLLSIYFILLSGAGGLARFKLPSIPFYLLVTSVGFNSVSMKFKKVK